MAQLAPDLITLIHQLGFRVTPQRQLILEAIRDGKGHCSPDEIFHRVVEKAPAVNRATVYRNLDFLCRMRLVVAVSISGHLYYELASPEPHHHLICRMCGEVEPIDHQLVKNLFEEVERQYAFWIDTDHLVLFGVCRQCREAKHNRIPDASFRRTSERFQHEA